MSIAFDLIALAVGYKVFADATKERKELKGGGRLVGIFIMTLALAVTVCTLVKWANKCQMDSKDFSYKMKCPISAKMRG